MRKSRGDEAVEQAYAVLPEGFCCRHKFSQVPRVIMDVGTGPGADQSFKDEADINRIMKRFAKTGILGMPGVQRVPFYGDISALPEDFLDAQATVLAARDAFGALPSGVREKFHNSPVEMLEWLRNPDNLKEARELGLVAPELVPDRAEPPKAAPPTAVPPAEAGKAQ